MTTTNNTGVTPIRDQVLVRRDQAETMTKSGLIHLIDDCKEWPTIGTVLAIGPWVKDEGLVPGARVLFKPRGDTALIPDDREGGKPEWDLVVMLVAGSDPEGNGRLDKRGKIAGDILGIVEEV